VKETGREKRSGSGVTCIPNVPALRPVPLVARRFAFLFTMTRACSLVSGKAPSELKHLFCSPMPHTLLILFLIDDPITSL
jgi:hypothetical protein